MGAVVLGLCATGLATGMVHVLTGPDHLSAIATLSVNVGNFRAFSYGVRWGVGHSVGLIVVGSVFIALENMSFDNGSNVETSEYSTSSRVIEIPQSIQNLAECFVGIFMLCLGFYNFYSAHRRRRAKDRNSHDDAEKREEDLLLEEGKIITDYGQVSEPIGTDKGKRAETNKFLSFCIGIFHGVAGPGGVLGVVPAVKLHNVWHSVAYLGSFCVSSIVTMGCFAALYGSVSATWTAKNDVLAYRMEIFSAWLSIIVGCTWLVLLYLGILDEIFP